MDYRRKTVTIRHLPGVQAFVKKVNSGGSLQCRVTVGAGIWKKDDVLTIMPYEVEVVGQKPKSSSRVLSTWSKKAGSGSLDATTQALKSS